jgi:flagellar hook protein FlgE
MGFQQGLSGLNSSSKSLEVIGNNVANANTYGAKSSRAEFADMYAASLGGGGSNGIGIGSRIGAVAQQFTQGNISTTSNNLDLAINGRGFFALTTPQGETVYSRNGQFKRDADGYIINNSAHKLLGQALDETGAPAGAAGSPIQLTNDASPPQKATAIKMTANLDAKAATIDTNTPVDFANSKTYDFVTSQTAYGDNGAPIAINYYFKKITDATPDATPGDGTGTGGQWEVYMSSDGNSNASSVSFDNNGAPKPVATFTFNADGTMPSGSLYTVDTIPGGRNGQALLGVTLDLNKITEYSGSSAVTDLSGGGYAQGNLADFKNLNGLQPIGDNEWKSTKQSGDPLPLGAPGSGVYGLLQSGALEESNVDLTGELVNMIVAQRTYQANAQTIKAEDQVLQTLVNLR